MKRRTLSDEIDRTIRLVQFATVLVVAVTLAVILGVVFA